MAEIGRFADRLREDRDRQQRMLDETQVQIEALQDLASHLRQSVDALDRLLAVDAAAVVSDPELDAMIATKPRVAKKVVPPPPDAPPVVNDEGPRGTDALRLVLESEPQREYSLAELLDALKTRGWLPPSRRPEEGVRLSLKRLAERGGAIRTDDGRWRAPTEADAPPSPPEAQGPVGGAVREWPTGTVLPPRR